MKSMTVTAERGMKVFWCSLLFPLLFSAQIALAQDKPADQKPADKQEQPKEEKKEEEKKEEKEVKPLPYRPFRIELGYGDWGRDGNDSKFRQYSTPPQGFFIKELSYLNNSPLPGFRGGFSLKTPGLADSIVGGEFALWHGMTSFEGNLRQHSYYFPTPLAVNPGDRNAAEGLFKQYVAPEFSLSMRYQLEEENHFFEPPRGTHRQRTRYWDAIAEGKVGSGQVSMGFTSWRFFDRTRQLPDTNVERFHLMGLIVPSSTLSFEGAYVHQNIMQNSRAASGMDTLSLLGNWWIGPSTEVEANWRQDLLNQSVVQNAYNRKQRSAGISLSQRWPGWTANVGLRYRDADRIRGDQAFINVPKWTTFEGRIAGRIAPRLRFTLRGSNQSLSSAPQMVTTDNRSLYWDDRSSLQLKLDAGTPDLNGYLVYNYRRWANGPRSASLDSDFVTIGGNWEASPRLSLFAEVNYESWGGKNDNTTAPFLDNFIPSSRVTVLGVSWALSSRIYLWANYTDFTTSNDNVLRLRDGNTRGHFLTTQLRYRFPAGHELSLLVAPWTYRDRVVGAMDYSATLVMLTGSARF